MSNHVDQTTVIFYTLPEEHWLYSSPLILIFNGKIGKRAEAGEWSFEIGKMVKGIYYSVVMLENLMNLPVDQQKELQAGKIDPYWFMYYLVDNAILRIYACLDKLSQMFRCYFEGYNNGGVIKAKDRYSCERVLDEHNCNFGMLLAGVLNDPNRNDVIKKELSKLNQNQSISKLREFRNSFVHKKNKKEPMPGLEANITNEYSDNFENIIKTQITFGEELPTVNWFRVEIVNAYNGIIECLKNTSMVVFPRDFEIKRIPQSNGTTTIQNVFQSPNTLNGKLLY